MAFAALKFLNEKYRHILEQLNDTVSAEDWILILQSEVTKSGRAVTSSTGVLLIPCVVSYFLAEPCHRGRSHCDRPRGRPSNRRRCCVLRDRCDRARSSAPPRGRLQAPASSSSTAARSRAPLLPGRSLSVRCGRYVRVSAPADALAHRASVGAGTCLLSRANGNQQRGRRFRFGAGVPRGAGPRGQGRGPG